MEKGHINYGEYFLVNGCIGANTRKFKISFEAQQGVRDLGTIDADGDGDLDIW